MSPGFPSVTEERCQQCSVLGGIEEPCLPPHYLANILETRGRECPRVVLEPSNRSLEFILIAYFDEALHSVLPLYFDAAIGHLSRDERRSLIARFTTAVKSEPVRDAIEAERQRQRDEVSKPRMH